jgi:hypothetical protein
MNNLTDTTLSLIDRASTKLGPFSALLDKIVEKVVPTTTAAACAGSLCVYTTCTQNQCGHHWMGYYYYSTAPHGCQEGIYTCSVMSCFC